MLAADHVIFATGYRAELTRVPYLSDVVDQLSITDGFPDLSEGFETSLAGLYITGFASTRDFGPFYGFTAGCASSARIAVTDMLRANQIPGAPVLRSPDTGINREMGRSPEGADANPGRQ
jgi:FAD-dependent urate hydroxylase